MFCILLLFAAAALLSGGRSSNDNRHMKLLELDNNFLNVQSKQATKKFITLIWKTNLIAGAGRGGAAGAEYSCLVVAGSNTLRASTKVYSYNGSSDLSERNKLLPLAPRILVTYKVLADCIGCSVVLPCRARGLPRPKIAWRDSTGHPIGNEPRIKTGLGEFTYLPHDEYVREHARRHLRLPRMT